MSISDFNKAGRRLARCLCFLLPLQAAIANAAAAELEADALRDDGDIVRAKGDVRGEFEGYGVCAAELEYVRSSGIVRAVGGFKLTRGEDILRGDKAEFDSRAGAATVERFFAELSDERLRLRGDKATLRQQQLSAAAAAVTSCEPESEIWRLFAGRVDADLDAEDIAVEDARFEFVGLPVMYLPRANFHYGDEKRSGFLWPRATFGSGGGVGGRIPYYAYLADNYDWTIAADWRSKHGLEMENEFRFLTSRSSGKAMLNGVWLEGEKRGRQNVEYLFDDAPWRLRLLADNVSDDGYLRDFGDGGGDKSKRNLPRLAMAEHVGDGWTARAQIEAFETLDDSLMPPPRLLPGLSLRGAGAGGNHDWRSEWRYDRFIGGDDETPNGGRFLWRGDVSRYDHFDALSVISGVGAQAVKYRVANGQNAAFFVPHGRLEAQAKRSAPVADSLRPDYRLRVAYVYSPAKRQDNAPLYDARLKRLTLENIYEWNRYVGGDRAADENFVAYGGEYRLIDAPAGREAAFLGIAQRHYLARSRASLPGEEKIRKGAGDILMQGRARHDKWRLLADAEWDARQNTMKRSRIDALVNLSDYRFFRVGFLSDDEETVSVGGAMPIGQHADFAASAEYLLDGDRYASSRFALRLRNACDCWRMFIEVSDSLVKKDDNDVEFSFGMEFVGLATIGGGYEDVLESLR